MLPFRISFGSIEITGAQTGTRTQSSPQSSSLAILLEIFLITVKCPAIGLEGDLLSGESDIDFVAAHRVIRTPSRDAVVPQQFDQ